MGEARGKGLYFQSAALRASRVRKMHSHPRVVKALCSTTTQVYVCIRTHFPCTAVFQVWALRYSSLGKGDMRPGMIWGLSLPLDLAFPQFWCWVSPPSLIYLASLKRHECSPAAKGWPAHETHGGVRSTGVTRLNRALPGIDKSLADINQKNPHWSQRIDLYQQRLMVFRFGVANLLRKHLICCLWIAVLSRNGCLSWIHPGWLPSEPCLNWRMTASTSPPNTSLPTALIAHHCSPLRPVLPLEGFEMENIFLLLFALLWSQGNPS